ncbi:hypothetical protein COOONC_04871 [Cooperia oncophora]
MMTSKRKLDSVKCELEELERQTLEVKQKQTENEAQVAAASSELEEQKAEVQREEEALKASREDYENRKAGAVAEFEKAESDFQQQASELSQQLESGHKVIEEAKTECEKLKESERLLNEFGETNRQTVEMQSKLPQMEKECEELRMKIESKRATLELENLKIEDLRKGAESNKLAKQRELEDENAEVAGLEAEVLRLETEADDMQNKKYELEGEIHLIKHQLSTKADELAAAKESFCHMQEAANVTSKEKISTNCAAGGQEAKIENGVEKPPGFGEEDTKEQGMDQKNRRSQINTSPQKLRTPKQKSKANKQSEKATREGAGEVRKYRNNLETCDNDGDDIEQVDTRNIDSDGVKSSELQHTNTLASTLADEFSNYFPICLEKMEQARIASQSLVFLERDIAVDLDDSMMVENDDNDDLFGDLSTDTPLKKNLGATQDKHSPRKPARTDDDIHFEPNELFTSTPLIVKKQ